VISDFELRQIEELKGEIDEEFRQQTT